MTDMNWMECNGAALRYALSGKGLRTLVLVHELAGSLNSWDALLPLLPVDLRVLRFDLRGSGMSEKVRGLLDLDLVCDDIVALLDGLGIGGKVIVAGAALGGAVAAHFACRFPERCDRLILIGPALGVPPERHAAALAIADLLDEKGMRAIAGDVFPKAFPEALWKSETEKRKAQARWLGADPLGYAAAYRMLVHANIRAELASIRCPVLALAGRHDPFGTPEIVEAATKVIPDVRFAVVEGGHFMSVQSTEQVAEAIKPFLQAA
ncbi:alpha/beta fold hydrolase [Rhizobium lusitanum]|uniref:Alpha/beta fold hydrolase n=1 Tax=Rhizobium lusitanum TaxID=293958 RepID=A0A6L9UKB0_9HYPH|nr:alpha/beta hydrolase [Rhizobium lusitanum]NEI74556.1 alpha/beta fold hydrolase [Rhizobium lusitanum]